MIKELKRPIRVLVAKVGLDGHDRGAKVIATALRDAGMEVIYTAHMTVFPKVLQLMKEKKMNDVLLTGGGIIPLEDIKKLQTMGVGSLFAPGAPTSEIAEYIKEWVKVNRNF